MTTRVPSHNPTGAAFMNAAWEERQTHEARGWTSEHDRKHGPDHPLRLALDYLANGKPVEAGALIYASLDVLASGPVSPIGVEWEYGKRDCAGVLPATSREEAQRWVDRQSADLDPELIRRVKPGPWEVVTDDRD